MHKFTFIFVTCSAPKQLFVPWWTVRLPYDFQDHSDLSMYRVSGVPKTYSQFSFGSVEDVYEFRSVALVLID